MWRGLVWLAVVWRSEQASLSILNFSHLAAVGWQTPRERYMNATQEATERNTIKIQVKVHETRVVL